MLPPTSTLQKYLGIIHTYDNDFKKWDGRVVKIIRRYRDDTRSASGNETAKFNILWSNVQTLVPAVYARMPKASVSRRFSDNDPVGRVAALLVERALDYEIEHYSDFRSSMKNAVEDRFLGGRGTAWVRYEPHIRKQDVPEDGYQITEDIEQGESAEGANEAALYPQDLTATTEEPTDVPEEIEYECSPADYVHWKDFGHSPARTWEEVTCVWRWVYMTKDALTERFGEDVAKKIPFDTSPETLTKMGQASKTNDRAKICELWDKETQKVYWLSENYADVIDERDDPLGLENFFPCPKPLFATTTSDTLIPVPDFVLYQDQANELDILTDRIDGLVKALRVRGVYDASQPALQRLLTEGDNNTLIPVDKWMAFSEKGGLKGAIDLLPIDTLAAVLIQCYQAQSQIKGQIYEITGISDIIRGQTAASETATAQQIKGQYAGLRLRAMQDGVAMFASELLRMKAQIICTKFQSQTILEYAGAAQMSQADQQMIPQALQLLQNSPLRAFRIEVAADSLVQLDETQTKQDRMDFLNAFSNFLREALPMGQQAPEMVPMLMEMMRFGVGGFKQAAAIEGTIDVALQQLEQGAAKAKQQPPQPSPEQLKMQAEQQAAQAQMQADMQLEQMRAQTNMQIEQMKAQATGQIELQKQQYEGQIKLQELAAKEQFERFKVELDATTKIAIAQISANQSSQGQQV
jgi:F0F1-type ATP synthase membrane subunit b/b'